MAALSTYYFKLDFFWSEHKAAYPDKDKQHQLEIAFIEEMVKRIEEAPDAPSSAYIIHDMAAFKILDRESEKLYLGYQVLSQVQKDSYYGKRALNRLSKKMNRWEGKKYLDVTFKDLSSAERSLSEFIGKPTIVEFWASWCRPCLQGMPALVKVYEKYQDKDLQVIAISIDQSEDAWRGTIAKTDLRFIHGLDIYRQAKTAYKLNSIPDNILLNAEGMILGQKLSTKEMESKLEQL